MGTVGKYVTLSVTYFPSVTYTLPNVTYTFSADPTNKLDRTKGPNLVKRLPDTFGLN